MHYAGRDSGCGSGNAAGHNGAGCRDRREEWNRCRCGTQADGSRYTGFIVSSHIAGSEVARALDAGGIAYLRKPFEMEELVAYIRRHTPCFHPKGLSIGMFNLRAGDSMLFKGEEPVRRLTDFEYKLLKLLAQNMNQTVSREQIVQELWEGTSGSEQSLNNYVARLRKYLSEDESLSLETVPRTGYMLSILGTQPRVL